MKLRAHRRSIAICAAALGLLLPLHLQSADKTSEPASELSGYTTRCAGYIAIAQYEAGLTYCNRALEMYELEWRVKLNRAAARLGFAPSAVA